MTDELDTNRLRALSEYSTTGLLSQAADEIDRLRAELAECLRCHVPDRGAGESLQAIRDGLHRTYDTATHAAVPHEELAQLRADARDPKGNIGGVLTYRTRGHNKPCGQMMGADGAGDFAMLLFGTVEQAHFKARQILDELRDAGHRNVEAIYVECAEDAGYHGNPVSAIDAAQQEEGHEM